MHINNRHVGRRGDRNIGGRFTIFGGLDVILMPLEQCLQYLSIVEIPINHQHHGAFLRQKNLLSFEIKVRFPLAALIRIFQSNWHKCLVLQAVNSDRAFTYVWRFNDFQRPRRNRWTSQVYGMIASQRRGPP